MLGPGDDDGPACRRAVRRGKHRKAAGFQQAGQCGEEGIAPCHMLDDFEAGDKVKLRARRGQILHRDALVINGQPAGFGMGLGGLDILRSGINRASGSAHARQRFGHQPRAAADIQCSQACQRPAALCIQPEMRQRQATDMRDAHRRDAVEHRRCALRIPPVRRQLAKEGGFVGVDAGSGGHFLSRLRRMACLPLPPPVPIRQGQ